VDSSFAKDDMEVLGEGKSNMTQQHMLASKTTNSTPGLHEEEHCQQVKGGDCSPLLSGTYWTESSEGPLK